MKMLITAVDDLYTTCGEKIISNMYSRELSEFWQTSEGTIAITLPSQYQPMLQIAQIQDMMFPPLREKSSSYNYLLGRSG
jgi:hypothetical protein